MKNSKKSDVSRGVIVFALNTKVDYVAIADQSSRLIKHNTGLPVTLVTDADSKPEFDYDHIIRIPKDTNQINGRGSEGGRVIEWRNFGRYLAYEFSPYEETILLDTDYLVLDDSLLKLFSTDFDYKLQHKNTTPYETSNDSMGNTSLPHVWATVVLFRKSERGRMLFELVGRIQRNYNYYCALYNISHANFRNDFAFAIANVILSGYDLNEDQGIPWPMLSLYHDVESIGFSGSFIKVNHKIILGDKWPLTTVLPRQNVHVLDKQYLLSPDFKQFVDTICEPT